jgi:hypothetical protein
MAVFCRACSLELFQEYGGEMDGITSQENWAKNVASVWICEGCGPIPVDPEGNCLWPECLEQGHPGHGLAPVALKKLSRLLAQLPEEYRAVPNIGIFPEQLGDHFRVTVRRHLTRGEFGWNREQRNRKDAWWFRPIEVEEVAFQVPLWEPTGLGRMRAWLRGTVGEYVATMEDLKVTIARQTGSN